MCTLVSSWRHSINYEPVLLLSGRPWKRARAIDNFDKRAEAPEELALHAIIESRSDADIIAIEPPELLDKGPGWLPVRALGLVDVNKAGRWNMAENALLPKRLAEWSGSPPTLVPAPAWGVLT